MGFLGLRLEEIGHDGAGDRGSRAVLDGPDLEAAEGAVRLLERASAKGREDFDQTLRCLRRISGEDDLRRVVEDERRGAWREDGHKGPRCALALHRGGFALKEVDIGKACLGTTSARCDGRRRHAVESAAKGPKPSSMYLEPLPRAPA